MNYFYFFETSKLKKNSFKKALPKINNLILNHAVIEREIETIHDKIF